MQARKRARTVQSIYKVHKKGTSKKILPVQAKNNLGDIYIVLIFICVHNVKNYILHVKEATKLYFMHYSCVGSILFNMNLYKSTFSTYSFEKLVFLFFYVLRFLPALF